MQTLITAELAGATKEVKGLTCKANHFKTKTKLELRFTKEDRAKLDVYGGLTSDIELLKAQGMSLVSLVITVEGAQAIGRLVNRSVVAFGKVGIEVGELEWEDESGVVTFEGVLPLTGLDLAPLMEVVVRLVMRSLAAIGHTHHPLTLFDLKQAIGVAYDAKQGEEDAVSILDWFNVRELIILEETKMEKAAAAKEKREKKKKERAVAKVAAKATAKDPKEGKEKNAPKAKAKAKAKTANLSHLTE